MRAAFVSIFFLAILPISAQTKGSLSPDVIYARSRTSVVMILTSDSQKQILAQGSGFIAAKNRIVTNYHVLAGSRSASIVFSDGSTATVTSVVAASAPQDLIIVEAETGGRSPLPIGNELQLKIGDPVYAIGAPSGLSASLSNGLVSAFRQEEGEFLVQTTAPIAPGSSGGPLLNSQGEVVGVTTSRLKDTGFGFAVSASDIQHLMKASLPFKIALSELPADETAAATDDPLKSVQALLDQEKYSDALSSFKALPSTARNGYEGQLLLCRIEENIPEYTLAIQACDTAISQRPQTADPYALKAFTLLRAGETAKAEAVAARAVQLSDEPYFKNVLGLVYYKEEKYSLVPSYFSESSSDPFELTLLVGAAYHSSNNDLFQRTYAKLTNVSGDNNGWRLYFDGIKAQNDLNFDLASADFRKCDEDSNFVDFVCILNLANTEMRRGNYESAKSTIDSAIARYPANHSVLSEGIFVDLVVGNKSDAQRLHDTLKATPYIPRDESTDCLYYYALGQAALAMGHCTNVAQNNPDSHGAWSNAGYAALDRGEYHAAESYFSKASDLFYASKDKHTVAEELDLAWGMTLAYYYSGDKKQAKVLYKALKKTYPEFISVANLKQLSLVWSDHTLILINKVNADFK